MLLEHVAPHVDYAVRINAEDVVVVGGVVDFAEGEAVGVSGRPRSARSGRMCEASSNSACRGRQMAQQVPYTETTSSRKRRC